MDDMLSTQVWPCCWPAVIVFIAMDTQWRIGMNGKTGLDYNALPFVLRVRRIPRNQWQRVFDDLLVMENEALIIFQEQHG